MLIPHYIRQCNCDLCNPPYFDACSNCLQEIHDYLKTVCADLHVTKGDFDEDGSYPEDKVLMMLDNIAERILLTKISSASFCDLLDRS